MFILKWAHPVGDEKQTGHVWPHMIKMEVSGQLHAMAALPPGKEPPVHIQ
jgi:hypothetical protein